MRSALFQRVQGLEGVLNRSLLLQMISCRLEEFTSARYQCLLRFGDSRRHTPLVCFKERSYIE
jgi:hypothetical protein